MCRCTDIDVQALRIKIVDGGQELLGYEHSSKYLFLCFTDFGRNWNNEGE